MVQATILGIIYIEWLRFHNNLAEQGWCEKATINITVPYMSTDEDTEVQRS